MPAHQAGKHHLVSVQPIAGGACTGQMKSGTASLTYKRQQIIVTRPQPGQPLYLSLVASVLLQGLALNIPKLIVFEIVFSHGLYVGEFRAKIHLQCFQHQSSKVPDLDDDIERP